MYNKHQTNSSSILNENTNNSVQVNKNVNHVSRVVNDENSHTPQDTAQVRIISSKNIVENGHWIKENDHVLKMRVLYQPWVLQTYGDKSRTKTITAKKYERIVKTLRGEIRNCAENSKFRFWIKCKGFRLGLPAEQSTITVDKDVLYVLERKGKEFTYKKVATVENFFDIIYDMHITNGARGLKHAGQKRTHHSITETYAFLPREAVTKFLMGCEECQKKQPTIHKSLVNKIENLDKIKNENMANSGSDYKILEQRPSSVEFSNFKSDEEEMDHCIRSIEMKDSSTDDSLHSSNSTSDQIVSETSSSGSANSASIPDKTDLFQIFDNRDSDDIDQKGIVNHFHGNNIRLHRRKRKYTTKIIKQTDTNSSINYNDAQSTPIKSEYRYLHNEQIHINGNTEKFNFQEIDEFQVENNNRIVETQELENSQFIFEEKQNEQGTCDNMRSKRIRLNLSSDEKEKNENEKFFQIINKHPRKTRTPRKRVQKMCSHIINEFPTRESNNKLYHQKMINGNHIMNKFEQDNESDSMFTSKCNSEFQFMLCDNVNTFISKWMSTNVTPEEIQECISVQKCYLQVGTLLQKISDSIGQALIQYCH